MPARGSQISAWRIQLSNTSPSKSPVMAPASEDQDAEERERAQGENEGVGVELPRLEEGAEPAAPRETAPTAFTVPSMSTRSTTRQREREIPTTGCTMIRS
jgi:hypothetical protein